MDFSNEHNLNQFKNNQYISDQTLFQSDSEFDEFDHHISQYDNKDDLMDYESNSDDQSRPLEEEEEFYSDDNNQLSLATSFCRNTQEQNEDFLEDKFNGEFLVDQFSEDKFIRCKYSEDFYIEQQLNKQHINSETDDDNQFVDNELNDLDKQLNEERSSEDERIIEKRKQHFLEFISTLPKICTPSVCGTMSSHNQFIDNRELNLGKLPEASEDELFDNADDDYEFDNKNNSNKNTSKKFRNQDYNSDDDQHKFDWSIDQLATLKPVDISIDERKYLRFKEFESDQLTQEKLIKENELFFSQETIAPSPSRQTFKHLDFASLGNELRKDKENKFNSKEEDDGKDSGNYSGSEIDKTSNLDSINKNDKLNEFELSFIEHSTRNRLSKIEFDCEMNTKIQLNTPIRIKETELIKNINIGNKLNRFDRLQQTSTPCNSIIRHQQQRKQFNNFINHNNDNLMNRQTINSSLPLRERNNIKHKKRLFHNLTTNNDDLFDNSS